MPNKTKKLGVKKLKKKLKNFLRFTKKKRRSSAVSPTRRASYPIRTIKRTTTQEGE